jgi:peptide/nickel transport system substrate-binding protein
METESTYISRRSFIKGAAIVGFFFTALGQIVGCGQPGSNDSSKAKETRQRLTLLFSDAPTSLDPAVGWDGWYVICRGITETLVQFDNNMNLYGCLATDWKMDDELTWRFTIREGVTFHTGNPMTPEAVKSSLERTIAMSKRSADKIKIESIRVEGNDIVLRSTQTIATMPGEITEPAFSIVDTTTADISPQTSGTGPFMGKEIVSMENFVLTRFEGYWGGKASVIELHNQMVTEASARTIALQSGDADVAWNIQASDLELFKNDSNYRVTASESVRMVFSFLNYVNPHLAIKEVRKALSFAVDREGICNKLLNGVLVSNGTLFPSYLSYSKAVVNKAQGYDIEQAKQLLSKAGYREGSDGKMMKDGQTLALRIAYYKSRPELPIIAQALQDQFGKIGISIELQLFENISELFHTDGFDIMLYNTTTIGNGDPSYYLGLYYSSDGSENANGYSNASVDEIIASMRQELDQEKRFALAIEAQKLILEDCPNLFFGSPIMNLVSKADISGFVMYPIQYYGVTNEVA